MKKIFVKRGLIVLGGMIFLLILTNPSDKAYTTYLQSNGFELYPEVPANPAINSKVPVISTLSDYHNSAKRSIRDTILHGDLYIIRAPESYTLIVHPIGAINVSQKAVPLIIAIEKFGNSPFVEQEVSISFIPGIHIPNNVLPLNDNHANYFAPAQFQVMTDAEKLSKSPFEKMLSGVFITMANDCTNNVKTVGERNQYRVILRPISKPIWGKSYNCLIFSIFKYTGYNQFQGEIKETHIGILSNFVKLRTQ